VSQITVSQFLRQYESQSTRLSYRTGLRLFFESVYPESSEDLDNLSLRYLSEKRDHREDVITFKESLKNKAPMTIGSRLNVVKVYLDENGISFPKRFFKNLNGRIHEAISEEKVPSNEELKRIIEYLPTHGKALALVLSSSGMRIGEAVKIGVSDVDLNRDPARIKIRAEYTKTGKKRITFISPEAKEAVEEWLNYRDQYVKRANGRSWEHGRQDDDRLFPFTPTNFNIMWRNSLVKAKLKEVDPKTNRVSLRPHNLRKFFRLRVGRYGRDEAEALMGHQVGLNKIYANFENAEERLKEIYIKSIPDLSIYGRTSVITDESFKKEVKKNEDTINVLIKDGYVKDKKIEWLSNEVEELKQKTTKEIDQLNQKVADMERDLHNWKMTVQDFDKIIDYTMSKMEKEAS